MNEDCIGQSVSLDCGDIGFYQGVIAAVDLPGQTLTLRKAFHNGKLVSMPSVTLSATAIEDLTFLPETAADRSSDSSGAAAASSSVPVVSKKKQRGAVAEALARSAAGGKRPVTRPARFSPAIAAAFPNATGKKGYHHQQQHYQQQQQHRMSPRKELQQHQQLQHRHAPSRRERERQRDEDCFGEEIDDGEMAQDFDFEHNLALFDKKMVFEEIEADEQAVRAANNQPDVVRLVDCNRRPQQQHVATQHQQQQHKPRNTPEPKYRNDENVLASAPAQFHPIETGEASPGPPGEYVTDAGVVVPAISIELRRRLEKALETAGYSEERVTELVARSAVELAVQLLGGSHRLNPTNQHQLPQAVVLCGPSRAGSLGVAAARHLASLGVKTMVYAPDLPHLPRSLEKERALYRLTGQKWTSKPKDLPKTPVDLIICALEDHEMWQQERSQPGLRAAKRWAENRDGGSGAQSNGNSGSNARAPVLAIDPPSAAPSPALASTRLTLLPGLLPLWYGAGSNGGDYGRVFMANLAAPASVFSAAGVLKYSSPFGAKNVLALHTVS